MKVIYPTAVIQSKKFKSKKLKTQTTFKIIKTNKLKSDKTIPLLKISSKTTNIKVKIPNKITKPKLR